MRADYTDLNIILDKSGSMFPLSKETIGGFNSFVEQQKKVPGKCTLSTVLFDTFFTTLHNGVDMRSVKPMTENEYKAGGNTALLDAIANTITGAGKRFSDMKEEDRPSKVLVVIMTDGEENSSREFGGPVGRQKVMEMIKHQREVYKWDFVFIGAGQDAIKAGASIGISAANTMSAGVTGQSVSDTYAAVASNTTAYRTSGDRSSLRFSKKQRDEQKSGGAHDDALNK